MMLVSLRLSIIKSSAAIRVFKVSAEFRVGLQSAQGSFGELGEQCLAAWVGLEKPINAKTQ